MSHLLPFLTSFLITFLTTPLAIKFANKYGLIDDPQKRPHPGRTQNRVVPRAGGLSIYIAIFLSILFLIPFDKHILGILFALTLLLTVGLLDDLLTKFDPLKRLFLQFLAAGIVVLSGVGIAFVTNPLGGYIRLDSFAIPVSLFGETHNIVLIADLFAFFWIVWVMNMVNWSKGVDGQLPGITGVAGIIIGLLSLGLYFKGDPNQLAIANLSFITAGASFGFLLFNWYPAKIFPGFSASTILGFMIAVLSILSGAKLATAMLVLLVPAVDFIYTFFRRILSGRSPFLGDSKHLHHLLLQIGWSHQKISLFYIISCAILGLLATSLSSQGKLFTALVAAVLLFGGLIWLHFSITSLEQPDQGSG